ncbi:MAG: tetratricopeptide repeat protein [Silvibacterium sp.]
MILIPALKTLRTAISAGSLLIFGAIFLTGQNLESPLTASVADVPNGGVHQNTAGEHLQQELKLGGDYLVGRGVVRDPAKSAYWYRKAADQGDPEAQDELGYFYLSGIGVQRDPAEAAKWFGRAMAGGSQLAKLNLAVLCLKGLGVSRNPQMGIDLLQQLARKNDSRGEDYLGLAYYLGYGVNIDHQAAEKWFAKAAKQHNPDAEYSMGTLYSVADGHMHDFSKAAEFLRSSANSGYVESMHSLGLLLLNHPEVAQQNGEALKLLETAAEAGSWQSSVVLGILARDGRGLSRNAKLGCRWFAIAAKQGGPTAEKYLNTDLELCKNALDDSAQAEQNLAVNSWLAQHPSRDLFMPRDNHQYTYFPSTETCALRQEETN